ncbi:MAG TPA: tetratricopeptide repeat protein [Vicinamibacterales bacterium]|nr:tetratricopeptide repeat protein [Vicinamibacterales bacterium]
MPIDREDTLKKAEKFLRQGRLDLAIGEYERVVEDQPRDWNTANALGELYMRAAQSDKAVAVYRRIADHLLADGFAPRAGALYKKILKIVPDDEPTQLNLAEISARQGLLVDAKAYLAAVGSRRRARGDAQGADEIIARLGALDPADYEARLNGAAAIARGGDPATAAAQFRDLHDELLERGRGSDALLALSEAVRCEPSDIRSRTTLVRAAAASGDADRVRQLLDRDTAGTDPALLFLLIDVELRTGNVEAAREMLPRLLALDPQLRESVTELAWALAASDPLAAAACVGAAADASLAAGEPADAAGILQEFATRVPGQVQVLVQLVEVCVDAGLDATMYEAQAQLTDAYLATGRPSEARVIAEDLVGREPWEGAHIDRLRRALEMLHVPDVEAAIAERVNSPAGPPVEGLDDSMRFDDFGIPEPAGLPAILVVADDDSASPPAPAARHQEQGSIEIDLTSILGDLRGAGPSPSSPPPPNDLDRVFAGMRDEAAQDEGSDEAGEHMAVARTYIEMGISDEAVEPLETAARSPRYRFEAAGTLARLARDKGDLLNAIEWFERAAETPAPSAEEGQALLYDLGATLQMAGESARALAVFLELEADVANYRDVTARVETLVRSQTGG